MKKDNILATILCSALILTGYLLAKVTTTPQNEDKERIYENYFRVTETLLDRAYEDNNSYFIDVLMESDEYYDYLDAQRPIIDYWESLDD